jgi:iron complex outermembrane receptor protein
MTSRANWRKTALYTALTAVGVTNMPSHSLAQGMVLEEVVVTARKREESLQDTPVAVTALDNEALREAGIRNLSDLNQVVPNIEVADANGNAGLANIYIRGVGQRNSGANVDSGVGIYIDGIYVGRPDGALLDVNDIQSIQVLRGPQGTLFGKNTTGGALVFTTNKPVEEFEAFVGARVGNYDRLDADFMLNVPLTDNLFTRLSGVTKQRDGYIDNAFDGEEYVDEDRSSLIWQTRWLPSDDLTLDLNLNWSETDQKARPQKCFPVDELVGWQSTLFDQLAVVPATGRTYDDFCEDAAAAGGGDPRTVLSDLGGEYKTENKGASLTLDWALSDNLSFKSITGWRYTEAGQDDELDHTATPYLHRTNHVHPISKPSETDQYTQEFQLTGSGFNDRLQYVTGLFWFKEDTGGRINVSYIGPYDPAIGNLIMINSTATEWAAENEAIAAFAQVEWAFNDNWRLTAGIRYTDEDREVERIRNYIDTDTLDLNGGSASHLGSGLYSVERPGFELNPNFGFEFGDRTTGEVSNDDVSGMASLQYLLEGNGWVDDGSVYLTYAEGFLSGGLSEGPSGSLDEFEPEEVENWELGFKLDMFDRRLRVNGAIFSTDYINRQLTTIKIDPNTQRPSGATINAKKSKIEGIELETIWLVTERLMINFNMTINDGDIEEFNDNQLTVADSGEVAANCERLNLSLIEVDSCLIDRSDENLPRLPEETYMLAAQYMLDTSLGTFMPRIQGSWKFDIEYCFEPSSCDVGYWLEDKQFDLSARVTWISANEKWIGAIYGTNLTDEDYFNGGTALTDASGLGGHAYSAPRMYGAELQYRF